MAKKQLPKKQTIRQPVVAVMGHVDHGKTSLLDSIRGARVAEKEFGGITQNTRAHEVVTHTGFKITFIDTPGHEAFSNMRQRGARVTDFVLLVVAADDGVQPQTKESIEFAHEYKVPIIVALNKIDLEGVKIEKIKQELSSYKVVIEEYGGDVMCFEVSAKNKTGLKELLEGIELLTEVNELKPKQPKEGVVAEAFVMESSLNKHVGYAALAILKAGNLTQRMFGVTQSGYFKVRAYLDENQKQLQIVNESQPFTVAGLKNDLQTGEIINFVEDEQAARNLESQLKTGEVDEDEASELQKLDPESLFAQMLMQKQEKDSGTSQKELKIILKTSTQGTLEAVTKEIEALENEESKVTILNSGTGEVTEKDIELAKIAKGIVITFQSDVPNSVAQIAKREKVLVRKYEIIYELLDELADVLDSMDKPIEEEIEMAKAEVLQVFTLSDGSQVAGCKVLDNKFLRGYQVKAVKLQSGHEDELRGTSKVKQLRQGKNEVKEIKKGMECGMLLEPAITDLAVGDFIIAYRVEKY